MTQTPTTCGAGMTNKKWTCSGTDPLPGGLTFPPLGWPILITTYNNIFNDTTGQGEFGNCNSPDATKVSTYQASNPLCKNSKTDSLLSSKSSQIFYYDGSSYTAQYTGSDCVATNLYRLTRNYVQACKDGAMTSYTGSSTPPSPPLNLANIAALETKYYGAGCVAANIKSQRWTASRCFDSKTVQCVGNATAGFTYRTASYTDGACTTLVNGTSGSPNPDDKNTQCDVSSDESKNYQCAAPGSGNSASSVSVSFISMVIVAIVALISQ